MASKAGLRVTVPKHSSMGPKHCKVFSDKRRSPSKN